MPFLIKIFIFNCFLTIRTSWKKSNLGAELFASKSVNHYHFWAALGPGCYLPSERWSTKKQLTLKTFHLHFSTHLVLCPSRNYYPYSTHPFHLIIVLVSGELPQSFRYWKLGNFSRRFTQRLPQGSVLAPLPFLFYINNLAFALNDDAVVALFAGNVSILNAAHKVPNLLPSQ